MSDCKSDTPPALARQHWPPGPGRKGSGKPARLYPAGYRYDEKTKKGFRTAELTAEETGREPPSKAGIPDDPVAGIRADYEEKDRQNIVGKAGGVRDRERMATSKRRISSNTITLKFVIPLTGIIFSAMAGLMSLEEGAFKFETGLLMGVSHFLHKKFC